MTTNPAHRLTLAVSGASGAIYGVRMLQHLVDAKCSVDVVYSSAARRVLKEECGIVLLDDLKVLLKKGQSADNLVLHSHTNIGAAPASGSAPHIATIIMPCSLSTLAAVSSGLASNLIERSAQVALKEQRKLIIVPRETPLSRLHIDCMSKLAWAGAHILPASPGFYHNPQTIEDLVDSVCAKVLKACGVKHQIVSEWDGSDE